MGAARQGLEVVLRACGVGVGDAVAVADFNCESLLAPLRHVGARPVVFDVRSDFSFDVPSLDASLAAPRVKAVVLTHYFGKSCWAPDLIQWVELVRSRGVLVIEDAAHSFFDDNQPDIGRHGDVVLFSFGNDKPLSVGKGGAVLIRNENLFPRVQKLYAALPFRSEDDERRLVYWHVLQTVLSDPQRCVWNVPCVPPSTAACPTVGEFDELLAFLNSSANIDEVLNLSYAQRVVGRWRWDNSRLGKVCRRLGVCRPTLAVNVGDVATPVQMGSVSRSVLAGYLQTGAIRLANARRHENCEQILGRSVEGARLRLTKVYPDASTATQAIMTARRRGFEVGCFNWGTTISRACRQEHVAASWAIRPELVVNYPCHPGLTSEDVKVLSELVGEEERHGEA